MLSPSLSVAPSDGNPLPNSSGTSTRRRGLSYLRSLSSHGNSSGSGSETPRSSPRHFFTRSTSYQEARNLQANDSRKRSRSRPNEPTTPVAAETSSLARVTTIDSPAAVERTATPPAEVANDPSAPSPATQNSTEDTMTRARTGTNQSDSVANLDGAPATRVVSASLANGEGDAKQNLPTIRLFPHQDVRAGRQSLNFTPVSRTLPTESSIIRVGRYSEREGPPSANPTHPSDAPVGFKSKVVSRKHCEFSFVDGQWQIKDVASSSGTFLNHIRLSQPNQESRLYPIKDGDIVQLGIDFRGGEEMIFRCVKIRIECNRSWQKKPNTFNKSRQAALRGLTKDQPGANSNSGECSICLGNVLPCQALFVAPCAHVWHYKCIRPMLEGKSSQYPHFQCPNCRAYSDLEADVELDQSDMDEWLEENAQRDSLLDTDQTDRGEVPDQALPETQTESTVQVPPTDSMATPTEQTMTLQPNLGSSGLLARRQATLSESQAVNGIQMPDPPNEDTMRAQLTQQRTQTESPNAEQIIAGEGPLTPRNNAGPFVFDGSGSVAMALTPSQNISEISDN